ncbi:MAG: 3-dehydroquinate synthase [Pirellulaceae bacterium]|nr:3-dehydroquinate synthase [Pirellulaceae bacterium]
MPVVISVHVPLAERSYDIQIGQGIVSALPEWLPDVLGRCNHIVIVADQRLETPLAQTLLESLSAAGYRTGLVTVPSGEASKSIAQADRLWQALLDQRSDRGSAIIALGGGVVGDLAGFVAATFTRGIPLIQIPTTLLSQVDSSVGGKTGINLPNAKNMVGCFWQPSLVVIDTETLSTLPARELASGLAEVVKYGVILKPDLFAYLEEHTPAILSKDPGAITHIVAESCRAKADVVSQDERETTGLRAILNYGHTFAHALEADGGYGKYLHGEAVAIGMHLAATCALRLGRIDATLVSRQRALLERLHLPITFTGHQPEQLWTLMQHDKKVQHGTLRFILPDRLGHVELVTGVDRQLVMDVLNHHL